MGRHGTKRTCFKTDKERITMSAKDYKICPSLFNAYIAKVSKRNPNMMLEDRRVIDEKEIFGLIEWYLHNYCVTNKTDNVTISAGGSELFTITAKGKLLEEINEELKEE